MHNDRNFFVLGLGLGGLPAAQFLQREGKVVAVWDDNEKKRQRAQECGLSIVYPNEEFWKHMPTIVLASGIPHEGEAAHPLMKEALKAGCSPICDVQLFFDFFPRCRAVGITGTSGKSTVCSLLASILQANNVPALWVGNGGIPIFEMEKGEMWQKSNHAEESPWLVLELSSYQLSLAHNLPVKYGIVLNIYPHHLNRHKNMENYVTIKERILSWATEGALRVVHPEENVSYSHWEKKSHMPQEKKWRLWAEKNVHPLASYVYTPSETFYMGHPPASFSFSCENSWIMLSQNHQNLAVVWSILHMMNLSALSFQIVSSFQPLTYRQEHVKTIKNITYINDSKATSPAASASALKNFTDIFWIVGGRLQQDDTSLLVPYLSHVAQGFTLGESSSRYAKFLTEHNIPVRQCTSLTEAVIDATAAARQYGKHAVVLLSPACESFDQFKNFQERGEIFSKSVMMVQ